MKKSKTLLLKFSTWTASKTKVTKTWSRFKKMVSTIRTGCLQEDIGTRTDVLYNNYDRNMVSGGMHHPALMSKVGVKLLIGSRYPRDDYDWDDFQKLAIDHTMIGSNGIGLVRKELYEAIVRQLGTTPHAGHSAILDLLYGNDPVT